MNTTEILTGIKNWVVGKLVLKQDVISDLATIRSGAAAGATAVQPSDLSAYFNDAAYDGNSKRINFYHGQTIVAYIDATAFVIDGMVEDVRIENGYLVIDFNTASGKQDISIPLTDIFDPSNYYTKTQADNLLAEKEAVANKVTTIDGDSTDTQYPSAKAVYDSVKAVSDTVARTGVYDVTANNSGATFASLSALLSDANLDTLIPTAVRHGGMNICFVLTSDNKYVQFRYMPSDATTAATFTNVANWQGVDNEPIAGSDNLVKSGGVYAEAGKKANIDGYYETMGVGTADNLTGQTERTNDAVYRKTGGSEEVATGTATISNIKGQTVAWNQLVDTDTIEVTPVNGRKICTVIDGVKSIITSDGSAIAVSGGTDMVFDLTLIYGAGNEPTTVAQFEADYERWFGKPLDYEEYDAGSLRSVQLDSLKTTGFNQYNNGQARVIGGLQYQITGTYTKLYPTVALIDYTYGDTVTAGTYYTNDNNHFVGVKNVSTYDNTKTYALGEYCAYNGAIYKSNVAIETAEEFDATHWDIISDVAAMVTEGILTLWDIIPDANGLFTPSTTGTLTIVGGGNDTCIHISGDRNGEYEPYEEHSVSLPVTTITGKLNGAGESVVVFPDGMKRAGSVYDEIVIKNGKAVAVKRLKKYTFDGTDYGSLKDWRHAEGFYASGFERAMATDIKRKAEIRMAELLTRSYANLYSTTPPISGISNSEMSDDYSIFIRVPSSIATTFKELNNWLNGKSFIYELATPEEYILDDFQLPISIQADALGTEEQTIPSGVASVPATIGIKYAIDAVGFILNAPKNYLSKESAENMLNAMVSEGVIESYTMTYDAANSRYVFTFAKTGVSVVPVTTSTTSLSAEVSKYYRFDVVVNDLAVTLPSVQDASNVNSIVLYFTAGSTPNVTFVSSASIRYQFGFAIQSGKTYEINAMWNGSSWVIASVEIVTV